LDLTLEVLGVSNQENTLFGSMCMQITIEEKFLLAIEIQEQFSSCIDCGLVLKRRLLVKPI